MYRSHISGTGSYLPEELITNADLEKMVETNDEWIVERTGIKQRHKAAPHENCSDLALQAAQRALKDAGLTASDLDMIVVATVSGDQVMPSTACVLQRKLGCRDIFSFDISAACSGFVYGLSVGDQFIRTGQYKHVLVVGAEVLTRFVSYKDRETCILFGDGAGAFVMSRAEAGDPAHVYSTHLHADGSLGDLFVLPAGGSAMPLTQQVLDQEMQFVKMKGREIFKHAVRTLSQCCSEALKANNLTSEDVDWVVPHQANLRILDAVAKHFGIPSEKVVVSLDETGNTSAGSVPIAFDLARKRGQIKRGDLVLLAAFGAGLTSGSAVLKF